uniref:Bm9679 n=1 Tax=Brugia malayi TaxID=6279 RepID=A0A0J9XSS4_BRUMA|nr:Bm9679 [Brugia malayi]
MEERGIQTENIPPDGRTRGCDARSFRLRDWEGGGGGVIGSLEGERRWSRLDEPQAAACCPERYSRPDLHEYERQLQLQHSTTPISYQRDCQQRQFHSKEISSCDSKKETTGEIGCDSCTPAAATFSKQKLEKLSQRQRSSIFAIARAKLSSFVSRLSISSGAGCATTRTLTSTSNITTANNSDLSSVISFPLRQNSHQNIIQANPHSATAVSVAAPALLSSSVQANTSLPTVTVFSNSDISDSCHNTGSTTLQKELHLIKSPVKTFTLPSDGNEYLYHLQKQKPTTSSASCSFFQHTNYPAAVFLTDGEKSFFRTVW